MARAHAPEPSPEPAAHDWRPMDTAPKDGSPVLSWDGHHYAVVAWSTRDLCWFVADDQRDDWETPLFWQPLPPPPASPEEKL
jgi:hypothetical protein